jgi:hypothetical protein
VRCEVCTGVRCEAFVDQPLSQAKFEGLVNPVVTQHHEHRPNSFSVLNLQHRRCWRHAEPPVDVPNSHRQRSMSAHGNWRVHGLPLACLVVSFALHAIGNCVNLHCLRSNFIRAATRKREPTAGFTYYFSSFYGLGKVIRSRLSRSFKKLALEQFALKSL